MALCLTPLQTCLIVTYGLTHIWPNMVPLRGVGLRNLNDFHSDLSRSLKIKCDCVFGLPIYAFLLIFNCNSRPNSALLQDTRLRNLNDLEFDLSRSLKVKCDGVIRLYIWFPIDVYSNRMSVSHRLAVIATRNVFSYLLSLGPNYEKSKVH